ncbi:helix-turn-helix domain-containing protein [Streptomyces roseolilacinus]|uniref:AraC family transcriptional regulator n=1 Tax=Streptomyces roseolilacinus TaxID=66904 RepID=A0A918EIC2_9ACTN|nr:AraC family transcriptional regulator [Streptomyces roseolilacinus]GGP95933.1 AraC family transcriptional regulator [Streptomyces roseolilacinus]
MTGPRRDTRGIVEARELLARVRFRRREPAAPLRPFLEHYWLVDWDLDEPYTTHVVPHPSVNLVFQRHGGKAAWGEVAGIGLELFTRKLEGRGRVCGVQFRPGGFRPFAPHRPVSYWTGRHVPLAEACLGPGRTPGRGGDPATAAAVTAPDGDDDVVAALDAFLLGLDPRPSPGAARATALVERVRGDRTIRRVDRLAALEGVSARSLQRLFAAYVGVSPKWVVLRYRIHEALERAESDGRTPDWAELAAELGFSDQAHLIRGFTATIGVPPAAYARGGRPVGRTRPVRPR